MVDGAGRLRGVVTRDGMIRGLMEHGPNVAVTDIMTHDSLHRTLRQAIEATAVRVF